MDRPDRAAAGDPATPGPAAVERRCQARIARLLSRTESLAAELQRLRRSLPEVAEREADAMSAHEVPRSVSYHLGSLIECGVTDLEQVARTLERAARATAESLETEWRELQEELPRLRALGGGTAGGRPASRPAGPGTILEWKR